MTTKSVTAIEDLSHHDKARLVVDFIHRTIMHYAMWYGEVRHQLPAGEAYDVLAEASRRSIGIQLQRLGQTLGFAVEDGLPQPLLDLPAETMERLLDNVAFNWLANDGVWFQAVEFSHGMNDAKRCNDSCWAQFSPFEAWSIRRFLGADRAAGLDGLKQALNLRVYGRINRQSFEDEGARAFVFRMDNCRVQAARQRKGLADYPCKSAGLVEYTYFARAFDARIKTECIGCPPDPHPDDWYCAWRFSLDEQ
ncbi:MAG: DUF6125 family protein [Desulfobacterales bacterium]|jgi:hypothetical protein